MHDLNTWQKGDIIECNSQEDWQHPVGANHYYRWDNWSIVHNAGILRGPERIKNKEDPEW